MEKVTLCIENETHDQETNAHVKTLRLNQELQNSKLGRVLSNKKRSLSCRQIDLLRVVHHSFNTQVIFGLRFSHTCLLSIRSRYAHKQMEGSGLGSAIELAKRPLMRQGTRMYYFVIDVECIQHFFYIFIDLLCSRGAIVSSYQQQIFQKLSGGEAFVMCPHSLSIRRDKNYLTL